MPPKRKTPKGPPPKVVTPQQEEEEESQEQVLEKFTLELQWCIKQIEMSMEKPKSQKHVEDLAKSHKTLSSSKAAMVKKRQIMRSMFGDYRAKMGQDEKTFKMDAPKLKEKVEAPSNSVFIKKAVDETDKSVDAVSEKDDKNGENKENALKFSTTENNFKFEFTPETDSQ
ncbi:unnamed protein product [Meganyctiphanes norvegica]|uniref:Uncharacterized protein n=1 Tax=Meganyctiphanes norvegica TaxID=48144 RepID=A0AAV2SLV7_MEGNR